MSFINTFFKTLLKLFSIILIVAVLSGIGYLLFYPNQSQINIFKQSLDVKQNSSNFTLRLFSKLAPAKIAETKADSPVIALEYISPDELARFTNEGEVTTSLEKYNTTISVQSADIFGQLREGVDGNAMNQGPWHFPLSVAPGELGNSVIIGHRYAEIPPSKNTFFNLDKIEVGDKIIISSDKEEYVFTVVQTKVVEKHDRSILEQTNDYRITLITCHPKWTSDQRLVVIGILDKLHRNI